MKKSKQAHPQRRWREVQKDELDSDLSRRGKPILISKAALKAASEMRKRNKQLEGRRKAAKRKKEKS